MDRSVWSLEGNAFHYVFLSADKRLSAHGDLERLENGFLLRAFLELDPNQQSPCSIARASAIRLPEGKQGTVSHPREVYVRESDLVATYEATPERPFRMQFLWRMEQQDFEEGSFWGLQTIVSVQTDLLDGRPSLYLVLSGLSGEQSALMSSSMLDWTSAATKSPLEFAKKQSQVWMWPVSGPMAAQGLWFAGYHPDFAQRSFVEHVGAEKRLVFQLFDQPLEKGVILRGRSLVGFVTVHDGFAGQSPQSPPLRKAAAKIWQTFVESAPPITA